MSSEMIKTHPAYFSDGVLTFIALVISLTEACTLNPLP